MNIPALFELSCAMIASELKGKDFNEMKRRYGLDDVNYTPAEEEEILKQYPWILAETEEKIKKLKLDQLWDVKYTRSGMSDALYNVT